MTAALLLSLLLAPESGRLWSEKHGVGLTIPNTWEAVEREAGPRVVTALGPQLGALRPRLVLYDACSVDGLTLEAVAATISKELESRPGWRITAQARHRVGPFPALRFGVAFTASGVACRGRVTALLLGGRVFTLELSAASSHFPGSIFDGIEKSLEVKWEEVKLEGGTTLRLPPGWKQDGGAIDGPAIGGAHARLFVVQEGDEKVEIPDPAAEGPKVKFLGKKRSTLLQERTAKGDLPPLRMLWMRAEGRTVVLIGAQEGWGDLLPLAEAILATVKLPA